MHAKGPRITERDDSVRTRRFFWRVITNIIQLVFVAYVYGFMHKPIGNIGVRFGREIVIVFQGATRCRCEIAAGKWRNGNDTGLLSSYMDNNEDDAGELQKDDARVE